MSALHNNVLSAHGLDQYSLNSSSSTRSLRKPISPDPSFGQTLLQAIAIAGPRLLANHLDPMGATHKRSFFHRFLTITLPDNAPIALLTWLNRIQPIEHLDSSSIGLLFAVPLLTISGAQMIEVVRYIAALGLDKIPHISAKVLADAVGPRDFYAKTYPTLEEQREILRR